LILATKMINFVKTYQKTSCIIRIMKQEIRKNTILDMLNQSDAVSIKEIAVACGVSDITARRDLVELEKEGYIIRTHGGAIRSEAVTNLFSFDTKLQRNRDKKMKVCETASRFVQPGDILFIDCGSTLYHLAGFIRNLKGIKVITNSLPIVSELIHSPGISIILVGGEVVNDRRAIYGPAAERCIAGYHARKAFVGADGASLKSGLSSYDDKESAITRRMIENADEVFLLCDSTKLEQDAFIRFAPLSVVDHLITNPGIDPVILARYQENKIDIITN